MSNCRPPASRPARRPWRAAAAAGLLVCIVAFPLHAAAQPPPPSAGTDDSPFAQENVSHSMNEIRDAVVRLPLAAMLGAVLALRPRRKNKAPRSVLVVQTQIMLAVVGAVVMLVVGNSLSRAFGIVGAAGLVRYRSSIDDPKEAVVMLCALGGGLAAGVGLYVLAPFATLFMAALLWVVEYFEPDARQEWELAITTKGAPEFRPKIESVLYGLGVTFNLLAEGEEMVSYSISAPIDLRTRDVSDTLRLLADCDMEVEWKEKKVKKK
jgi:hypothetical protein